MLAVLSYFYVLLNEGNVFLWFQLLKKAKYKVFVEGKYIVKKDIHLSGVFRNYKGANFLALVS